MDKRTFLALLLTAIVIVGVPILFRSNAPRRATLPSTDTATAGATAVGGASKAPAATSPAVADTSATAARATPGSLPSSATAARLPAETTTVALGKARYQFSTLGAEPVTVALTDYRDLRPGERRAEASLASATALGARGPAPALLRYRLVLGGDTLALDTIPFRAVHEGNRVMFTSATTPRITVRYELSADGYLTRVRGEVAAAADSVGSAQLLVDLPTGLRSQEADTIDDARHRAYSYKLSQNGVKSVSFDKLDPTLVRTDSGPMAWVATRTKYFLVALLAPPAPEGVAFTAVRLQGGPRLDKLPPIAAATAIQPLRGGRFAFDLYAGPQSWERMRAIGNELENVNPYGGWIPGVQPFATICMRVLLWMKQTLNVSYGWVLVIFGIAVRLLLWPLNQSAMRSSIKMQRLQPELMEVQKKYKNDPEKQREALVKLYAQHGMSPFSPVMGCLPMLLPMPVLFALFFVFQNTIEFRGVPFLWLPDISLKDPLYIMPIVMGVTMFVLSWIGMRAAPPNPQTKMMSYMMPAVMTMVLLNFASGLNLYYAVQNVAALPQQWLLSRERMKAGPVPTSAPLRGRRAAT